LSLIHTSVLVKDSKLFCLSLGTTLLHGDTCRCGCQLKWHPQQVSATSLCPGKLQCQIRATKAKTVHVKSSTLLEHIELVNRVTKMQ